MPYLSASAVVIHYEEALYQVYAPLPLPLPLRSFCVPRDQIRQGTRPSARQLWCQRALKGNGEKCVFLGRWGI